MLPAERQKKILSWLQQEGHLKISDLSRRLQVSEMTVHRDVRVLVDQGRVVKTYGGISLASPPVEAPGRGSGTCAYCRRPVDDRLSMTANHADGSVETYCCPHCALLACAQRPSQPRSLLGRDFLLGHTVGAAAGWYVMGADMPTLCCEPQVLLFGERQDAERFVRGFGGEIFDFDEATREIQLRMNRPNTACCHQEAGRE
ncbi:DeoR family transcriptional regulator [Kyrpidia sp.]|uniref:DeoR family transcriptional regulator n=1 Tax=Kyrpidia sp. TaxID=2073077 RepID=UPI0025892719|nr:DeoR family transcriptional regulator [Kyrpidia sp.]MCL6577202.1 DeoR family transcriptional regulator [Kyrpidia sp.]